ncbi:PREDICTED: uncharacterized protein LOC104985680 isoform X2 [Bison bison bison]|uniref:Uncharacterized protein LOC104985680 isoform X2 n=1 Tax=Bison bison bison TaxID=43346 RepID=A0A6P3H580_BISBB|nr:PREDICTED: uncharacterized protein LOC104985680 isoform X2 [Bison bison bison]
MSDSHCRDVISCTNCVFTEKQTLKLMSPPPHLKLETGCPSGKRGLRDQLCAPGGAYCRISRGQKSFTRLKPRYLGKNAFPWLFQLLEATCVPWRLAPSSIFRMHHSRLFSHHHTLFLSAVSLPLGDADCFPGQETKIPHAAEKLGRITAREGRTLQRNIPCTATETRCSQIHKR